MKFTFQAAHTHTCGGFSHRIAPARVEIEDEEKFHVIYRFSRRMNVEKNVAGESGKFEHTIFFQFSLFP